MLAYFRSWLFRVGLLETAVLSTLLVLAACIWVFIAVADEVGEGDTRAFDERVLASMRHDDGTPVGPRWLVPMALDLTALGSGTVVALVTTFAAGLLLLRRRWGTFLLVVASVAGGGVLSTALKRAFDRARPDASLRLTDVSSLSFPSGHSMLAAVTYFTLAALLARTTMDRRLKAYFLTTAAVLVVIIGATRMYLGVHFPTDVLGGWCAGIAWALLCSLAARWLQRKGAVEDAAPAPVAVE